jgi:phage major head subunit gpT-like protein
MIRAVDVTTAYDKAIQCDAQTVEWVNAAGSGEGAADDAPKKFKMRAYTGGPMSVGYYGDPVVIDLKGLTAKAPVPILMNHDLDKIVGHADTIDVGKSTIDLSGLVSGASAESAQVTASAKDGFPWKASVGARPDKMEFVGEGIKTTVNGKTLTGPLYVARKSTLGEVSFVAVGADSRTSAKVAASAAPLSQENNMGFQDWVKALFGGIVPELTDQQTAALQARYDAEIKADAPPVAPGAVEPVPVEGAAPPAFDLAGIVLTYEKHVAGVQASAAGYVGKIDAEKLAEIQATANTKAATLKASALNDEWAPARLEVELVKAAADTRVELIQAERPAGPSIHGSSRDVSIPAIQAALCRSTGHVDMEKQFTPEVLEASDRYRHLGLQEVLLLCAREGGYSGRQRVGTDNLREVLEAAFSTHTLTTLLTTTGNKSLLAGFNAVPQSWREVAVPSTVSDFKTVTAFRMTADLEYEEVGPAGLIKHGTLGQESYTQKALTYAKIIALTRQDIINDDLGAFNEIRKRLGMGAAIKQNAIFWTAWLAAANAGTFWTAARGNYQTGGATALGETALGTAVKLFRDMIGPDGNLMSLNPDRILIPTDVEVTGRKLYVSQEMRNTTASTKTLTSNIYHNQFRPIIVPELSNDNYTGYSATAWWLLTDPAVLASAVMCFLNGQQSPTIESADADFNTLGIQFRGYHDFGVSMSEYRPSVHSVGA